MKSAQANLPLFRERGFVIMKCMFRPCREVLVCSFISSDRTAKLGMFACDHGGTITQVRL